MILFELAVKMKNGIVQRIGWWPSIVRRKDDSNNMEVTKWSVLPIEHYIEEWLRDWDCTIERHRWRQYGNLKVAESLYKNDRRLFIEGMMYLLASYDNTLGEIVERMKEDGYDTGEYDVIS